MALDNLEENEMNYRRFALVALLLLAVSAPAMAADASVEDNTEIRERPQTSLEFGLLTGNASPDVEAAPYGEENRELEFAGGIAVGASHRFDFAEQHGLRLRGQWITLSDLTYDYLDYWDLSASAGYVFAPTGWFEGEVGVGAGISEVTTEAFRRIENSPVYEGTSYTDVRPAIRLTFTPSFFVIRGSLEWQHFLSADVNGSNGLDWQFVEVDDAIRTSVELGGRFADYLEVVMVYTHSSWSVEYGQGDGRSALVENSPGYAMVRASLLF